MQERDKKVGKKTIEKNAITEGVIWKQLLIFFFPIMLGTLIQQLYTTVDTIIVGRFVGKRHLQVSEDRQPYYRRSLLPSSMVWRMGRQLLSHNIMVQRTGRACTWGYIQHICSLS